MDLRPLRDRRIEAAHPQQYRARARPFGHDVRAALRAEISRLARRGLKTPEQVLASRPPKAVARNIGHRREGGAMRLSADAAVAMNDRSHFGVHLIGHASTQAAPSKHRRASP